MNINFVKFSLPSFVVSGVLFVASIFFLSVKGLDVSIDFSGGLVMEFTQENGDLTAEIIRNNLHIDGVKEIQVQTIGEKGMMVKMSVKNHTDSQEISTIFQQRLNELAFQNVDKLTIDRVDFVSPQIGNELAIKALIAVLVAVLGIVVYVVARFEWEYSVGAAFSLVHDIVITLGFMSLFGLTFDMSSIAALLTILGYSINDSVVIFDRIRATKIQNPKLPINEVVNISINSTLSRTTITSGTTILSVLALVFFGGAAIHSFAMTTLFGISIGTLSSIFVSATTLIYIKRK